MLSNYPPGAADDPEAPYNQPLDEDEEIALLQAIYYPKRNHKRKGIFAYAYKDHTNVMYNMESGTSTVNEEQAFATESDLKEYVFKDLIEFV